MNGNQAAARLYAFEREYLGVEWLKDVGSKRLAGLLKDVWRIEGYDPRTVPELVSGAGVARYGKPMSCAVLWSDDTLTIELVKGQRNEIVLLHEIAHCLGHWDHGRSFVADYLGLLILCTRYTGQDLRAAAREFKLEGYCERTDR